MIRGVIFDMDGVLVDNQGFHKEAFKVICEKYGVPWEGVDFGSLFGMGNDGILTAIMPEVVKREGWRRIGDEKEALYRELFSRAVAPVRGLPEFLRALKEESYRVAVGSSGSNENVDFVLSRCGIAEYFDAIVTGDMVTECKPDPEIYLTAAGKLGLAAEECVVMEDAPAGIQAARRAGCPVVVLATTFPREQHTDYDILIDDFTQITPTDIAGLGR